MAAPIRRLSYFLQNQSRGKGVAGFSRRAKNIAYILIMFKKTILPGGLRIITAPMQGIIEKRAVTAARFCFDLSS